MAFVRDKLAPQFLDGPYPQAILGTDLSSEAYLLSELLKTGPSRRFVRITKDLKEGLLLKENLEFFLSEKGQDALIWFPPYDTLPYTGILQGPDIVADRLKALKNLLEKDAFILIVPIASVFRKLIPSKILRTHQRLLAVGEAIDRDLLLDWLVRAGYRNEVVVESPGAFAIRGGLLDIFSPQEANPLRIELEGDTIFNIRYFDAATQTSLKMASPKEAHLMPASEILFFDENIETAKRQLRKFEEELDLPGALRKEVLEQISEKKYFAGLETFLPAFYEEKISLFDYFPEQTVIFSPEPEAFSKEYKQTLEELRSLFRSTKSWERLVAPEELFSPLPLQSEGRRNIYIHPLLETMGPVHRLKIENSSVLKNKWSPKMLQEWRDARFNIRMVCHTPIQAERLSDLLHSQGIAAGKIEIGKLSHGFIWEEEGVLVLTEEEIFGHKTIRRTKSVKSGVPFSSFAELQKGDHLVHEEHGICRYEGLKHMNIQGIPGDFLILEFFGGDKLYLPVYRMNVVQRYIGASTTPVLDQLGGVRWQKIKKRAGEQVIKIAAELLKIHAQRELHDGNSYPSLDMLDEEFASHFPFDETPDQSKAIDDIFADLQKTRPMDRLICGDVGYGKTEVAMRAAFKVAGNGRQVAVLVPTTILALQHFETFSERFSKLAMRVEMLSRFKTTAEQKEIVQQLAAGKLDIVIGTHRLLAKDIQFKNLGLLIIDEEHRFGVRHKEKIKKWRPTIDVLTLSATPIPRTLHMSLIGLRDLSTIHTPPVDRLAIRTYIAKWEDAVIRHTIDQELARGGQIFFVHNRVATIEAVHKRLVELFPNVKIGVAHGQMAEETLEEVMIDFLHHKSEILLCTAIIESGIDVPNANTMIINRADTFGLAQLYQLRGRVGRSDRQAHCYLLVKDFEAMTKESKERLSVLTRNVELGAGFQIASHDLEIRGAGNLLGSAQSGFIEEIGYELYTKMLAATIRRLKGEKWEEELNPEIFLKIPAFLPEDYLVDTALRMELYKRMAHLGDEAEVSAFREELKDRFGAPPEPVENLLEVIVIRQMASRLRLKSFKFDEQHFVMEWDAATPVDPKKIMTLVQKEPKRYQLKPNGYFYCKTPSLKTPLDIILEAKNLLGLFL